MTTRIDINALFARAEAAFRAGRPDEAEPLLARVRQAVPQASLPWHLTALVAEQHGRAADAEAAFARALTLAPDNAALLCDMAARAGDTDQALTLFARALAAAPGSALTWLRRGQLFHRLGRWAESRADLLRVYQIDPQLVAGWVARGAMERDAGIPASARIAFDRALALAPADVAARRGRAWVALETGEADAATRFAALAADDPGDPEIAIAEAEARELGGDPQAARRLATLIERQPGWAAGHSVLARMLWEAGDPGFEQPLRRALDAEPGDARLHDVLIALLAGIDRFGEAADASRDAAAATGQARFRLAEAQQAGASGDDDRAATLLAGLPAGLDGRALIEARHLIRTGAADRAEPLLAAVIAADPGSVAAWALRDLVWRAIGDRRAVWLHGQPGLIRRHHLTLDDAQVAAIARHLRGLHRTRRHPVGQSMRGGTQTRGRLLSRDEPMIHDLRRAIGEAVTVHWRGLPPGDSNHPLLRHREHTPALVGSWSVRLTGGGHHVGHIHPEGVISSASYWVVPATSERGAGDLEIGRPPADLRLDLPPLASFAAEPGTLVLFPSTAFHGTRAFAAGERITMAFDLTAG